MEKLVDAIEETDFAFDKVREVTDFLSHERPCKHCDKVYSTLLCPCIEDRYEF